VSGFGDAVRSEDVWYPDKEDSVQLQVKGRHVEVNPALEEYAEKKLQKVGRHLREPIEIELELIAERNPAIGATQVAEATVWANGHILRAREGSHDLKASIDLMVDKLERQAKKLHDKNLRKPAHKTRAAANGNANEEDERSDENEDRVVKVKQFALKPMSTDEAILQLELLGHAFFVFRNAETMEVNVLYKRRDGKFGLIEPQLL
jgi:putative sigma-54 modulation protein